MHDMEFVRKLSHGRGRHLTLAFEAQGSRGPFPSISATRRPIDMKTVRRLTHAMMNRLWIPHTTTIVGLLDVGLSRDNFDELSKWIVVQLATAPNSGSANELPRLERRFRRAVDRFPEP